MHVQAAISSCALVYPHGSAQPVQPEGHHRHECQPTTASIPAERLSNNGKTLRPRLLRQPAKHHRKILPAIAALNHLLIEAKRLRGQRRG
jgi:hypothetical protein